MKFEDSVIARLRGFLYRCKADSDYTMIGLTSGITAVFGHAAADIIDNRIRSYSSLIHPDDLAFVDAAVTASIAAKSNWDIDYRLRRSDGGHSWVHETGGGVWDDNDGLLYLEGGVTDIDAMHTRVQRRTEQLERVASRTSEVLESLRYLKLLALNAGIEAARAGQAGAGFAVLAQEMRRLAYESEGLAKSIAAA